MIFTLFLQNKGPDIYNLYIFQPGVKVTHHTAFDPNGSGHNIWNNLCNNGCLGSSQGIAKKQFSFLFPSDFQIKQDSDLVPSCFFSGSQDVASDVKGFSSFIYIYHQRKITNSLSSVW